MSGSEFASQVVQQVHGGIYRELHVVSGGGLERVVTDAAVLTAYKQHGLGKNMVDFHRVVASAAWQPEDSQAGLFNGLLPAALPGRVTRCGSDLHHLLNAESDAASFSDTLSRRARISSIFDRLSKNAVMSSGSK